MDTARRDLRSNVAWLAALGGCPADPAAIEDLADFLRRGLAAVLQARRDIQQQDLEDFTQEALLRVIQGLETFRGDSRFTTWALAVATRVAFTELRRRRVRHRAAESWERLLDAAGEPEVRCAERPAATPDEQAAGRDLLETLRGLIRTGLSERQRTAVLAELEGLPTVEIAERLGTNTNALYKLHHDARRKLRAGLVAAGFGPGDLGRRLASEASP